MTQEQKEKIIELYNLGVTKTNIAKQVGLSRSTITRFFSESQIPKIDTMIGKRFNRLIVLQRDNKHQTRGGIYYQCQCDCGNIISVLGSSLRSGHTKSCGCLQKEKVKEIGHKNTKDLTGLVFGRLTVISRAGFTDSNKAIWHCKCSCGNETDVRAYNLISGNTLSCGCLHSANEEKIIKILNTKKINYQTQVSFDDLKGNDKKLRFDFGIYDNQKNLLCLLEYQGEQHTNINNPWHTELLETYDNKKRIYCKENNIDLYELNKYDNLEQRIEEILNNYKND